jgi:hypothetical protein
MTKEQVVAALKCCINPSQNHNCDNCPLGDIDSLSERRSILMKAALALIEGPELVTKEECSCVGCFHNCTNFCDDIKNCRKNEFLELDFVTDARLTDVKDCPEGESERFPVKTIDVETRFGKISIEWPDIDKGNDDTKIRVLDSNGEYMDYFEIESFEIRATERGTTLDQEIESYADELRSAKHIDEFCDVIYNTWDEAVHISDWYLFVPVLKVTSQEEVMKNEFVNQVGDYLILVPEC